MQCSIAGALDSTAGSLWALNACEAPLHVTLRSVRNAYAALQLHRSGHASKSRDGRLAVRKDGYWRPSAESIASVVIAVHSSNVTVPQPPHSAQSGSDEYFKHRYSMDCWIHDS
jgi:hypothetical protein